MLKTLKKCLDELDVSDNHPIRYSDRDTCLLCKFFCTDRPDDTKGRLIRYSRWVDHGFVCDKYIRGLITDIKDSDIEEINAISGINTDTYEVISDRISNIQKEIEKGYQKHFKVIWKCSCCDLGKHTEIFYSMGDAVKRSKYLHIYGIDKHDIHILSSKGRRKEENEETEEEKDET